MSLFKKSLFLTVLFEGSALVSRFLLKLESTRDTDFLKHLTFGLRVHHGYFGVLILLVFLFKKDLFGKYTAWVIALAIGLIASDLIHHFLILWPITGHPHFDLVYPR